MRLNPTALCDVLRLDKTPNEYGEPRNTWTTVVTGIWMEIAPILGRDFIQAVSMGVAVDAKIRGRWIDGVAQDMRIRDDRGRVWDIVSAIDVEDRHTELLCYVSPPPLFFLRDVDQRRPSMPPRLPQDPAGRQ